MDTLTPVQAGRRLGITDAAVRDMVHAGRLGNLTAAGHKPFAIPAADVARVQLERRSHALRRIGDEAAFARRCREQIWPKAPAPRADGRFDAAALAEALSVPSGHAALRLLPDYARELWGPTILETAATRFSGGACATCSARYAARVHGTFGPRDDEPTRILLGAPCGQCTTVLAAEARTARRKVQRLQQGEAEYRDRARLAQFDAEQRAAMAAVQKASSQFARIVKLRKQAGLPPLGGK